MRDVFAKLFALLLLACFTPMDQAKGNFDPTMDVEIEARVMSLNSAVSLRYNDQVSDRIYQYCHKSKNISEIFLGRISMYFPLFEEELKKRDMPLDLKYLPIIESGLKPHATSRAGAAGLWQFMRRTARGKGLKVNSTIDERRDVHKSTEAALDYLAELHERFGDWTMALAAYNCGPGNVRKAIRRSGGKTDYWAIHKYLPRETRNYIPKFIAMSYTMQYYYLHDMWPKQIDNDLIYTATAKVFDKVSLKDISKSYDLDLDMVKLLNPAYIRGYIPKSEDGRYSITLPQHHLFDFVSVKGSFEDVTFVAGEIANRKIEKDIPSTEVIENVDTSTSIAEPRDVKFPALTAVRSEKYLTPQRKKKTSDRDKIARSMVGYLEI